MLTLPRKIMICKQRAGSQSCWAASGWGGWLWGEMNLKRSKKEAETSKKDRRNKDIVNQHCTGYHRNSSYSCPDCEYFSQTTALCYVTNSCILLRNYDGTAAKWDMSRSAETLRTCRISASYIKICLVTDFLGFKWHQLADAKWYHKQMK